MRNLHEIPEYRVSRISLLTDLHATDPWLLEYMNRAPRLQPYQEEMAVRYVDPPAGDYATLNRYQQERIHMLEREVYRLQREARERYYRVVDDFYRGLDDPETVR